MIGNLNSTYLKLQPKQAQETSLGLIEPYHLAPEWVDGLNSQLRTKLLMKIHENEAHPRGEVIL